eukprot:Platyproteum_vivax@DN3308_c0_g1_i1.p2
MEWTKLLEESLPINCALVQVNLPGSFDGWGTTSLEEDAKGIDLLFKYLSEEFNIKHIAMIGHSTGCQNIVTWSKYKGKESPCNVVGAVLKGGVSDRQALGNFPEVKALLQEAQQKLDAGADKNTILSQKFFGAPMSIYRLHRCPLHT